MVDEDKLSWLQVSRKIPSMIDNPSMYSKEQLEHALEGLMQFGDCYDFDYQFKKNELRRAIQYNH